MSTAVGSPVLIIGSGFGGAICAHRLTKKGHKVILIERGPWRNTVPVQSAGIAERAPLPDRGGIGYLLRRIFAPSGPKNGIPIRKKGFIEVHATGDVVAVCSSGVGGGSHIWSALMVRPEKNFWDGVASGVSDAAMELHYEMVYGELGGAFPAQPETVPNRPSFKWKDAEYLTHVPEEGQPAIGLLFPKSPGDVATRTDANGVVRTPSDFVRPEGTFGSSSGAKSMVDALYLLPALKTGNLLIRDLCEVELVEQSEAGGYTVKFRDLRTGAIEQLSSPKVVLSAGTINTMKLLFKSREAGGLTGIPALGKGVGTNGDYMATWHVKSSAPVDSTQGTPCHGRIKIKGHEDTGYILIAGVDVPPLPGPLRALAKKSAQKKYQLIAMGADRANGIASYREGRLSLAYKAEENPIYGEIADAFRTLERASGWKVKFDPNTVLTAHLMGGCRISDDPSLGVVDGRGEVHGHPGLFVADASALPRPAAVPPSLTIAAWASHVGSSVA